MWTLQYALWRGIHSFRKDCSTQTSTCSPWHTQVRPFPSLRRKMKDYIKEWQAIINPFAANKEYPTRPNPSLFAKKPKPPQTKRSNTETKYDIKKLHKPRKVDREHSKMFHHNGLAQTKQQRPHPRIPQLPNQLHQ